LFATDEAPDHVPDMRMFDEASPVGAFFSLLEKTDEWLKELQGFAISRADDARQRFPQTVQRVGDQLPPQPRQIRQVWPPVTVQVPLARSGTLTTPMDIQLVPPEPDVRPGAANAELGLLSVRDWVPEEARNDRQILTLRRRGIGFLGSIEDEIRDGLVL